MPRQAPKLSERWGCGPSRPASPPCSLWLWQAHTGFMWPLPPLSPSTPSLCLESHFRAALEGRTLFPLHLPWHPPTTGFIKGRQAAIVQRQREVGESGRKNLCSSLFWSPFWGLSQLSPDRWVSTEGWQMTSLALAWGSDLLSQAFSLDSEVAGHSGHCSRFIFVFI